MVDETQKHTCLFSKASAGNTASSHTAHHLETETTFATIGKEGVPEINMMSIQDFISIPMGKNVHNNLDFGRKLKKQPIVFGVNYFLKEVGNGKYLNSPQDKHVWIKWMELRVHNEVDAVKTPTGYIPKYEDLKKLFKQVLNKDYAKEDYIKQFTIRVPENLAKIERVQRFYQENVTDTPLEMFGILYMQRQRLLEAKEKYGDYISPENFEKEAGPDKKWKTNQFFFPFFGSNF